MKLSLERGQRSSRCGYEWYNHEGTTWLNVWVGDPDVHRWWAFSLHIYLR
jgi:hypothetical protein